MSGGRFAFFLRRRRLPNGTDRRSAPARNPVRDMRAGAKRSRTHTRNTRETGTRRRQAASGANGTKRDGGTTCGTPTDRALAKPAESGVEGRVMTCA